MVFTEVVYADDFFMTDDDEDMLSEGSIGEHRTTDGFLSEDELRSFGKFAKNQYKLLL